jgi:hypothetical protein
MTSAGKWVLGLLLLVVGAVFVARTVSSDPGSQAREVKLPSAANAGAAKDADADAKAKAAAEAAAKKVASTTAGDLACKKACVEVNEVANDSITTAKLAPGSVTLSKLAFEVPNLNELENEINARKAAEAATKQAQAEAAAESAKTGAAITAAASNGITAEAAARTAADEALAKNVAAADASLLGSLNKELADRASADDVLQGKLTDEIHRSESALTNLRGELANPKQVDAPILKINNNEIVDSAVQSNSILDETITAADLGKSSVTTDEILDDTVAAVDLADNAVVGRAAGETLTNVKLRTLRGERVSNTVTALSAGDLAVGTITGERTPLVGSAVGNIALGTIGTENIADGQITIAKLAGDTILVLDNLRADLTTEVAARKADVDTEENDRKAAVDAEELARTTADSDLQDALNQEISDRGDADTAISDSLTAETDARTLADATLTTNLSQEIADRATAVTNEATARNTAISTSVGALATSLSTAGTINTPGNPVDWTKLKGVPTGFADGVDDDGNGKVAGLKTALATGDGSAPNTGDNSVSWQNLGDVPTAFVDGNISFAELTSVSTVLADGAVSFAELTGVPTALSDALADNALKFNDLGGTIGVAQIAGDTVTAAMLDPGLRGTITTLTSDVGTLKTDVLNLKQSFTDLANITKTSPSVATTHLTGTHNDAIAATASVPDPIPAGGTAVVTLTVSNIGPEDLLTVTPPIDLGAGVLIQRSVATTGQVIVTLYNATAAPKSIPVVGGQTWKVQWIDLAA